MPKAQKETPTFHQLQDEDFPPLLVEKCNYSVNQMRKEVHNHSQIIPRSQHKRNASASFSFRPDFRSFVGRSQKPKRSYFMPPHTMTWRNLPRLVRK